MVTWNDLDQLEQEAMGGKFPIEFQFKAEYWKTLEAKGLVTTGRIDHKRGYADITDAGRAIIPEDESEQLHDYDPHEGDVNTSNLSIGDIVQISDFPKAQVTRINRNNVWVLYEDGKRGCVALTDCAPVTMLELVQEQAAKDGTITRLEELRPVLQEVMLDLNRPLALFRPHRIELEQLGLVQKSVSGDSELTERGSALVADYQRRNGSKIAHIDTLVKELFPIEGEQPEPTSVQQIERAALIKAEKRIKELEAILQPFADDFEAYMDAYEIDEEEIDGFTEWLMKRWDSEAVFDSFNACYEALKAQGSGE